MIRLPEETPLVGFHGMADSYGIVSLGLILLDTLDPVCHQPLDNSDMSLYQGMNDFQSSKFAEDQISREEKDRAKGLEAILIFDSMVKARESKEEVMEQIKTLHSYKPIKLHEDKPASIDDLKELLDRLAHSDVENMPAARTEFELNESEVKEMYEKIQNGQKIDTAFEGTHVEDFKDLLAIQNKKQDLKLNKLLTEMYKYEKIESENKEFIAKEYNYMDTEIESYKDSMIAM